MTKSRTREHHLSSQEAGALMRRATYAAVAVAIILIGLKATAYQVTGSVSMLGTLLDSVLDASASLVNLFAVHFALQPADEDHRFGHGKAEALAGLGQAIFVSASALFILVQAGRHFINPEPITQSLMGIGVILVTIVLTMGLVLFQRYVVARTNSLAIEADSLHYKGDLLMNFTVLVAFILAGYADLGWADSVFAIFIALFLARSAWNIVKGASRQLMDQEISDADRERIKEIAITWPGSKGIHDLRTRASGADLFIQFHLEMDPALTLRDAHKIADGLEKKLMQTFSASEVLIHQDPLGDEDISEFQRS
ncbi:MAG: cation diffusion facilitator family transporter [Parvibaculaceae bacterium]|nr:cation diffusion facilitator family transporter [Parvibaculaceae bacterium]